MKIISPVITVVNSSEGVDMFFCPICKKRVQVGLNRPHSLHRTRKLVKPNIQKYQGKSICTRCLRTLNHKIKEA